MTENPLYDALFAPHAGRDAPFLTFADGGTLTYAGFLALVDRLAATLHAAGIAPGDRVAAQVEKSQASLALYAACTRTGAVFLPLNTAYPDEEVQFFLRDCAVSLFFCDPGRAPTLAPVAAGLGARVCTMAPDGRGDWETVAGPTNPTGTTGPIAPRGTDDLAAMLYTSGTTGRPKGAMLSHGNLLSNTRSLSRLWGIGAGDVLLHALPVYHSHGLFVASNVILLNGAQMLWLPKFDAAQAIRLMPRATLMMGVPTFYTRLLSDPAFGRDTAGHMRLFISGSAPLLAQTHAEFEARTGQRILERYGLTETSMNTSNPLDGPRKAGTVGLPLPDVDLRIAPGEGAVGEIQVKGPNVFKGYWGLPDKTAEAFTEDGWFRTGDLGTLDQDGYVTIVGRSKDLIITGGLNVYPKEVEALIDAADGVLESAVFGLPDADFGERVAAAVVPVPGVQLDLDAIQAALAPRLARFKQPKEWHAVPELPRNAMGKVQKNALRQTYS
ncbi:AMP-binding protein [Chachezhania sediminis]|uniref:AMP-binding protein n=1 Tax=Chachezhania sediminis TaxID=2599291 RepID=UPI00131DCED8|nr:AMP-binding protein [Chachezhania sediminis]